MASLYYDGDGGVMGFGRRIEAAYAWHYTGGAASTLLQGLSKTIADSPAWKAWTAGRFGALNVLNGVTVASTAHDGRPGRAAITAIAEVGDAAVLLRAFDDWARVSARGAGARPLAAGWLNVVARSPKLQVALASNRNLAGLAFNLASTAAWLTYETHSRNSQMKAAANPPLRRMVLQLVGDAATADDLMQQDMWNGRNPARNLSALLDHWDIAADQRAAFVRKLGAQRAPLLATIGMVEKRLQPSNKVASLLGAQAAAEVAIPLVDGHPAAAPATPAWGVTVPSSVRGIADWAEHTIGIEPREVLLRPEPR